MRNSILVRHVTTCAKLVVTIALLTTVALAAGFKLEAEIPGLESLLKVTPHTNGVTVEFERDKSIPGFGTLEGIGKTSEEAITSTKQALSFDIKEPGDVYCRFSKGYISAPVNISKSYPAATDLIDHVKPWSNRVIYHAASESMSNYGIKCYEYQIDSGNWMNAGHAGLFQIGNEGIHTIGVRARGYDNTPGQLTQVTTRIDRSPPIVDFDVDESLAMGMGTVRVSATDPESGIWYIALPSGEKVYEDKALWKTTENGIYVIDVYNNAGNYTTQTFNFSKLNEDYYIHDAKILPAAVIGGKLEIEAILGCRIQKYPTVAVRVFDTATGEIYHQEEISISAGTQVRKHFSIAGVDLKNTKQVTLQINPAEYKNEKIPTDNTRDLNVDGKTYNLAIPNILVDNINVVPGQEISVTAQLNATGINSNMKVPLEFYIKRNGESRVLLDTQLAEIAPTSEDALGSNSSTYQVIGTVVAPKTPGTFEIVVEVNRLRMSEESNQEDNRREISMNAADRNLGVQYAISYPNSDLPTSDYKSIIDKEVLGFRGRDLQSTNDSSEISPTFLFRPSIASEKITSIVFNHKEVALKPLEGVYPLSVENVTYGDKLPLRIVMASADGKYSKTYDLFVTKQSDATTLRINYASGSFKGDILLDPTMQETIIKLPQASNKLKVDMSTEFEGAQITTVNGQTNKNLLKNRWSENTSLQSGDKTYTVLVMPEDALASSTQPTEYTIVFSTTDTKTKITLLNTDELNGATFGPTCVIPSGSAEPLDYKFGKTTKIVQAKRDGVVDGILIQLEVKDDNIDQMLQGRITLGGSNASSYPIHWDSFAGPTSIQASKARYGYCFIRVLESLPQGEQPINIEVTSLREDGSEISKEQYAKGVKVTISSKAPVVTVAKTPESEGSSTISVTVAPPDMINPAPLANYELKYQLSKNDGNTWTPAKDFKESGEQIKGSGRILVKITAKDKLKNIGTGVIPLTFETSGESTEFNVFSRKTRLADYYFIGTNKESDSLLDPEAFDFGGSTNP